MASNITNLADLQRRKAELSLLCKAKELEIGGQVDYISEHLGSIALRSFVGGYGKKEGSSKADIITMLVSEGMETAFEIQKDPHNIKDKVVAFIKKAAAGVINIIVK